MIKIDSKSQLFWLCQYCGWLAYALLTELMIKMPSSEPWVIHLPHLLLDTVSGFCITLLLRALYAKFRQRQAVVSAGLHIVCLLTASVIWTQLKWHSLQWFYGSWWQPMTGFDFGTWTSASLTMLATWTAGYYGIKMYLDNAEQRHQAAEALHLAKESQLKMLRYQLNPHFMFNSINAICTLILKQHNANAVAMLEKLCDFLRYSVYTDPLAKITVQEEIAILQTYLDLEQCRFQSGLKVQIQADDDCYAALMPSLLLQPLVENALKHGIDQQHGVVITVIFKQVAHQLHISVSDTGSGFNLSAMASKGIGIKNCQDRLQLIYPQSSDFTLENDENGGARVTIAIPLEFSEQTP